MKEEYFSDLNYTLSNEDTRIEYELMSDSCQHVFSIAGSGARCIPLIAKNPKKIHIVDMSPAQILYCELKWQALKQLSYQQWLFFMGYRGALQGGLDQGDSRIELFNQLHLRDELKKYWQIRSDGWAPRGFILLGKWESHFQKIGKVFKDFLKCDFDFIFKAQNLEEQKRLYKMHWPHLRWKSLLRVLASEYVFNKFLYKGHFSGQAKHRTEKRPPYQLIAEEFERIFTTQLLRKNYFMQILFLGEIRYEEGLPLEAHEFIFLKAQKSSTEVEYLTGDLLNVLPQFNFDFISLSDTISYLPTDKASKILQILSKKSLLPTTAVIRSFMRAPTALDTDGWVQDAAAESWAHQKDGTGVYQFHIFKAKV
ncbi:MAG: DUF3419 family protein [Pseudobdellovibrionaceae bacterium]